MTRNPLPSNYLKGGEKPLLIRERALYRRVLTAVMIAAVLGVVAVMGILPTYAQSASRSFDSASVAPGGTVTVTITASETTGQAGGVTETLPTGFSYVDSSLTSSQVTELSDNQVRFTLQGDTSFTYSVTASNTPGSYDFVGMLRDFERDNHTVGGATMVTVTASPSGPTPSASRSFDSASVAPGGTVTVTITASGYGQAGGVTETLPTGFSYVDSSLASSQVTELSDNQVRFTLQGDTSFTYSVTASNTPGSYDFVGMLRDFERDNYTVGGATMVTVTASPSGPTPSASRSFDSASVAPGGTVTVTITAAGYGQAGGVTETLPTGFSYVDSSLASSQVTELMAATRSASPSRTRHPSPTASPRRTRRAPTISWVCSGTSTGTTTPSSALMRLGLGVPRHRRSRSPRRSRSRRQTIRAWWIPCRLTER